MPNFAPMPHLQFFDSDGNPLSGGSLVTSESGGSTPLATYSDAALSVTNGTTITLNAAGRPAVGGNEVAVFLLIDKTYRFTLKNSAGTVIWTADEIAGAFSAKYKYAAMSGGDATITAAQDLTGATVSLDRIGVWQVTATFSVSIDASANAANFEGVLNFDGSDVGHAQPLFYISTTGQAIRISLTQSWFVTVSSQPKTAKLRGLRVSGTGTVVCFQNETNISAVWIGN